MMSPLRAVSQSTRRAQILAVLLMSVIAAPVALWTSRASAANPLDALLLASFVVSFFAMRLLCIRLPQGDVVCITLMAGLAALGVLDIGPTLAVSATAGILDAVARLSQSSRDAAVKRLMDTARGTAVLALVSPWQVIVRPSLVRFSLTLWAVMSPSARRRRMPSTCGRTAWGTMTLACCPRSSAAV